MERWSRLFTSIRQNYDNSDPGHDFAHILRVLDNCQRIGRAENANLSLLMPAALLHDIVNVPKNHPDRINASQKAAARAKDLLLTHGYTEEEVAKIAIIIKEHSFSLGLKPSSLESAILQDADRLDALGAIGLMRTVTCGALMGSSYYHFEEPIAESRPLDDRRYTIDHLYVKLFKLLALFNTSFAREEGRRRVEFMQAFVEQLRSEIPRDESLLKI